MSAPEEHVEGSGLMTYAPGMARGSSLDVVTSDERNFVTLIAIDGLSGVITLQVTKCPPGTKLAVNFVTSIRLEWSGIRPLRRSTPLNCNYMYREEANFTVCPV